MENIIPFTEFSASAVEASKLRTLENNGKMVFLSYKGKPIVLQTPEMIAPYGLSKWDNDGKSPAKYTLDLSFKGMESRDMLKKFYEAMEDFDKVMMKNGLEHSEEWFKKKHPESVIEALYTCAIRRSKDDKYPPTFKMTVPYDNNNMDPTGGVCFRCKVFDKVTKEKLDLNVLNLKQARVTAIVQCTGVWIAGGKFGTTWKVLQLRAEQTSKIPEYAFRDIEGDNADLDEDDEDDMDNDIPKRKSSTDDSDDDFIDDDEEDDLDRKPVKSTKSKK